MQFLVPQFIDVETKIIGPISARQFVIMLITAGLLFLYFKLFKLIIFFPSAFITATMGGVLAFGKVNGQTMHYFLLNAIGTLKRPSLKLWGRGRYIPVEHEVEAVAKVITKKENLTESRLASMSLMVDTGGAYVSDEIRNTPAASAPPPPPQQQNTNGQQLK